MTNIASQEVERTFSTEGTGQMRERETWDWETGKRLVVELSKFRERLTAVHELSVSPDGTRIAAPGAVSDSAFGICVNGELWEGEYEKAWHLQFGPDGRLTALVRLDDQWTVAVDGTPWEERWDFAWDTRISADGKTICVLAKRDNKHTVAVNGQPWEDSFFSCRGYTVSDDGKRVAALVQVEAVAEADIDKFKQGTWTVAVDGKPWEARFLNVYGVQISADSAHVAAEARLSATEYTVAQDGQPWASRFGCVWRPCFRSGGGLLAPVRIGAEWALAEGGKVVWAGRYTQLWHQKVAPDDKRVAAVVATRPGRWTIAVDDEPWAAVFGHAILAPVFSPDGTRIAAAARTNGSWKLAVDGEVWPEDYDMVWDPVFSPDGKVVLAKVEQRGEYAIAANGRPWSERFTALWEPVFSPDGRKVLIRGVQDDKYFRQVVPAQAIGG